MNFNALLAYRFIGFTLRSTQVVRRLLAIDRNKNKIILDHYHIKRKHPPDSGHILQISTANNK